jgi:hypothetical protein
MTDVMLSMDCLPNVPDSPTSYICFEALVGNKQFWDVKHAQIYITFNTLAIAWLSVRVRLACCTELGLPRRRCAAWH